MAWVRPDTGRASLPLTVIRDGKEQTLTVQIAELPEETKLQQAIAEPPSRNRLGLLVTELPAGKRKPGEQGVLVKDVDEGPAASANIRPGDIITRINNVEVTDTLVEELRNHVGHEMGPIAKPEKISIVSQLPKTRSGKIMRRVLKAKELGQDLGDISTIED